MENNQQRKEGDNSLGNKVTTSFSNQQPGQQVPTDKRREKSDQTVSSRSEQHSESSMPEGENETLGTP